MSSASVHSKEEKVDIEVSKNTTVLTGTDEDFGGTEARRKLERRLLRKLDLRMSILIIIYILNYVSFQPRSFAVHGGAC